MKYAVKVHTNDPNVSAMMLIEAPSEADAKQAAKARVKGDHPHVTIREVVVESYEE